MTALSPNPSPVDEEAAELVVRRWQGDWEEVDQTVLDERRARDPAFADAYGRAEEAWASFQAHAETPEFMRHREAALAFARHANADRWAQSKGRSKSRWEWIAAAAILAVAVGVGWQLSPYAYVPGQFETHLGEQRTIDLEDRSRITLDASTLVRVDFTKDARVVRLLQGQAQFNVAHDPGRPFKVIAGTREIVAVGTIFTVEYADHEVHVAMLEGKVAVIDPSIEVTSSSSAAPRPIPRPLELAAGEELHVSSSGRNQVTPKADLEAATAWREGKIIFRAESLEEAIRRVNRYSHTKIDLEPGALSQAKISGVFEAGDTQGFLDAIEQYLPVTAESAGSDRIQLRAR